MIKSNKAQGSVEILIGIFFIIFFIYIFNILAANTVETLEINKIKEQEQEIVLSLSDFLYSGVNVLEEGYNIIAYDATYRIPLIMVPSQNPTCTVTIDKFDISIVTEYNDRNVSYSIANIIPQDSYNLSSPIVTNCGSELSCTIDTGKLECS